MEFRLPKPYEVNPEEHKGENAPKNFPGMIMEDEKWLVCPYDTNHRVLRSGRQFSHLINCRNVYMKKKQQLKEEMDIGICPHNWRHHVPLAEMEEHKKNCDNRYAIFTYLKMYDEKQATVKMRSLIHFASNDWGDNTPTPSVFGASMANPTGAGRAGVDDDLAGQIVEKIKRKGAYGMKPFDPSVYQRYLRQSPSASLDQNLGRLHLYSSDAADTTDSEDWNRYAKAFRPRSNESNEPNEPAGRGRGRGRARARGFRNDKN